MAVASSGGGGGALGAVLRFGWCTLRLGFRHLADLLTAARLAATVPVALFVLEGRDEPAFWLFLAAGASDIADGFVAKWVNRPTTFGAVLDPVADKVFIGTLFVVLTLEGAVPVWLCAMVLVRDAAIALGAAILQARVRSFRVEPLVVGKLCTLVQLVYLGFVLGERAGIAWAGAWLDPLAFGVVALVVASAAAYLAAGLRWALAARGTAER